MDTQFDSKRYWEERLKDNWGLHGVGYIGYGKYYNGWLYKVRRNAFSYHIKTLDISNFETIKVLDIGSGTGFYLSLFKSLGVKTIIGSDIAKVAVERLTKSYSELSIVQLDIGDFLEPQGLSRNDFDIITAFDVLFHIVDDKKFQKAFSNIFMLLKPGGYFIFSDNFPHNKVIRNIHQVSRSIGEIDTIIKEAGFIVVRRAPMFVLMNTPVDTKGRLPCLLWRLLMAPVRIFNPIGLLYGALLFPLELFLIRVLKESPSTELMICKRAN